MNPTPENIRFHAAGHIAAAALVAVHFPDAAQTIMRVVLAYVDDPNVDAPPQLREKVAQCVDDPCNHLMTMAQLEMWFSDPYNTQFEQAGIRMGKG